MKKFVVYVVALVMLGISIFEIGRYSYSYLKVEQDQERLGRIVQEQSLDSIYATINNVVGWIKIDGMKLDNPIMQTTNNEFYLSHDYKGEKARTGSIFLDYRNNPRFTDRHSIIYGHVLRNGSMFGQLAQYANGDFAKEHKEITIELENETLYLQVFAAYETTTDFYYIETRFTDATMEQFITTIQNKSLISMDTTVTYEDQIVTLSTCTKSTDEKERFVVHAKIVERKGK
jgi:sortase B